MQSPVLNILGMKTLSNPIVAVKPQRPWCSEYVWRGRVGVKGTQAWAERVCVVSGHGRTSSCWEGPMQGWPGSVGSDQSLGE